MTVIANAVSAAISTNGNNTDSSAEQREIVLEIDGIRLGRILLPKMNQEADRLGYKSILQYE